MRKSPSQRRLWKTVRHRPRSLASASSRVPSAASSAKGFSTTTCLPARSARSASAAWLSFGVATTTRSSSGSASSASTASTRTPGQSRATASASAAWQQHSE